MKRRDFVSLSLAAPLLGIAGKSRYAYAQETGRVLQPLRDIFNGSYDAYYASAPGSTKVLGTFDLEKEDVIGVFFKKIPISSSIGAYHMYILVHSHKFKKQVIFRGGPTMDVPPEYGIVYFITGAAPNPDPGLMLKSFGYLEGVVGLNRPPELVDDRDRPGKKLLIGSVDFDRAGENSGVIIKTGADLSMHINKFAEFTEYINKLKVRYNPRYPNSNSYVTNALRYAGLPTAKEAIYSYPPGTPNRQFFDNLFTPGAEVIDLTRSDVVYDTRMGRSLSEIYGPLSNDPMSVEAGLNIDDHFSESIPSSRYFYNKNEYDEVVRINKEIDKIGIGNVSIPKVDLNK